MARHDSFDDYLREKLGNKGTKTPVGELKSSTADSFAMELMREVKISRKNMFTIVKFQSVVICVLLLIITGGLLWYLKQPKYNQAIKSDGDVSNITQEVEQEK